MPQSRDRTRQPPLAGFPIRRFRRIRFGRGLFCPHCGHTDIHRWGQFQGRQRYRCLGCDRTFSDFTGTPLAYLKRVELWPRFCQLAFLATTIRDVARQLGMHTNTSFRWRHRFLASLHRTESVELVGRVSVGMDWLPRSEKGSRRLSRPPRRVSFQGFFSFEAPSVWLVAACDETGRSICDPVGRRVPGSGELRQVLSGRVSAGATLLCRRNRTMLIAPVATSLGLAADRQPFRPWYAARSELPEPARFYLNRLKRWLRHHFRGVATKYLDHYAVWLRLLDLTHGHCTHPRPLDRVLLGAFP